MDGLAIWSDWESALIAFAALCALYLAVMWITAIVWTYRDISERTTDPVERGASVLIVAFFGIPGLLLHVLIRPKTTLEDRMDRRLEAEAMFQDIHERPACPQCATRIQPDFITCPSCRAELRTPCETCRQALATDWVICPYCQAERAPAPAKPARRAVTAARQPAATLSPGLAASSRRA
jgi:hypothetical protein